MVFQVVGHVEGVELREDLNPLASQEGHPLGREAPGTQPDGVDPELFEPATRVQDLLRNPTVDPADHHVGPRSRRLRGQGHRSCDHRERKGSWSDSIHQIPQRGPT